MARLSTHALDLTLGQPAAGLRIDLYRLRGEERERLTTAVTNGEGRTDRPLLENGPLPLGVFELVFHAGDYFAGRGEAQSRPPFLDEIVIRFGIAEPEGNYHVPLLLAPYGYSTYRGS